MGPVTHDIYTIGIVIVIILSISANIVPIFYWITFPWREYDEGKAIMISAIGLALLVDLALFFKVIPVPPIVKYSVADAVYAVIAAGSYYKLFALVRNWVDDGGPQRIKAAGISIRDRARDWGKAAWARVRDRLSHKARP